MIDQDHASGHCPSCGRFIGPQGRCPYCGAEVRQRVAVRALKIASLGLASLGLAVLLWAATHSQAPAAAIGSLAGTMNWAYIRIEGQATRQPVYDAEDGSLQFWVGDGTGELMVLAYRAEAAELLSGGRIPVMGDRVAAEGTLRVRDEFAYLLLSAPQSLEIRAAEPASLPIGEVGTQPLYRQVTVRGIVRDERAPYEGLRILTLRDATGEVEVTVPASAEALGPLPRVAIGQAVQVTGAVDPYRDAIQVSVGRGSDVILLEEAVSIAPARRSGDLEAADVGSMAQIEGRIVRVDPITGGAKYRVDDGSGATTVLVWQDLAGALPGGAGLAAGAAIRAQGRVAEYHGQIEIVPEVAADIAVVATPERATALPGPALPSPTTAATGSPAPAPVAATTEPPTPLPTATLTPEPPSPSPPPTPAATPTPPIEQRAIAAIGGADIGQVLSIGKAGISERFFLSKGVKYRLADGTGQISLLLWQDVLEEVPGRYDLFPGSQVQVRGEIDQYEGELEIIPGDGEDLAVIHRGQRPGMEERTADRISAADEGRIFAVQGRVSRIEGQGWLKLWLRDDSGEILVFVPERVVGYLPSGIGPGQELRVTGEVDIYQGTLEIIPLAGADLELRP